ncbi:urease accessory protein UreE [Kordiimonas aestuarii]|uniref:urease accessory protein UreE n=1 Tax=Kordiimonas aestuarii TaxID=1005925 RepID=UPI0021D1BB8B|nr:urease accessory protein UreE [Kordiimonas aestuarii]
MTDNHLVASEVLSKGTWQGDAVDRVVLSYDDRFRRRVMLKSEKGADVLLSLKEAILLQSGDALLIGADRLIEVVAAPDKLIEIRCESEKALLRTAWHLGNRHLATEILKGSLRIRYDKVILEMVEQLGADARVVDAPFNPEGGAYSGGHTKVHGHDHDLHP